MFLGIRKYTKTLGTYNADNLIPTNVEPLRPLMSCRETFKEDFITVVSKVFVIKHKPF